MPSSPVGWTTATACCMVLQRSNWISSNPCYVGRASRTSQTKVWFDLVWYARQASLASRSTTNRIDEYKICMLVHQCRRNEAPTYLAEMLHPVIPFSRYKLRSESEKMYDFEIPRTRSVRSGPRSFSVSGPTLWNSLPFSVEETASLNIGTFKRDLKTILFSRVLNTVWFDSICCSWTVRAPLWRPCHKGAFLK